MSEQQKSNMISQSCFTQQSLKINIYVPASSFLIETLLNKYNSFWLKYHRTQIVKYQMKFIVLKNVCSIELGTGIWSGTLKRTPSSCCKKSAFRAGERAPWSTALATLAKDPDSVPNTHAAAYKCL